MADDLTRPYIGYRFAGRRPESQQDRRASADAPLAALRGMVSGVLGAPGDIESLVRMLPGLSEQTVLPTSEDVERRLPLRSVSETPIGRVATGMGTLGGGFYTGPGSPLRAAAALPSAVRRAGADFAAAAGQPAVNVVKPKGGNWLAGSVEKVTGPFKREYPETLAYLENAWLKNGVADTPGAANIRSERHQSEAMNRWLEQKLGKYIKNEMATPEDPLRALAEKGVSHMSVEDLAAGNWVPESLAVARMKAGYPPLGMAESPAAKGWETAADRFLNVAPASEHTKPLTASEARMGYISNVDANPWLLKVPPETPVYYPESGKIGDMDMGFPHLVDELKNAINSDSGLPANLRWKYSDLDKVTVPQAVQRVHDINEWRAAQKAEADAARAMNPATHLVKEYPEQGMSWVELAPRKDKPIYTAENLPKGYELTKDNDGYYQVVNRNVGEIPTTDSFSRDPDQAISKFNEWISQKGTDPALADALKYEGETMGHCVGGYCPDVVAGKSKIYSLRDKKGQPHVTIEVQPNARMARHDEVLAEIRAAHPDDYDSLTGTAWDIAYDDALKSATEKLPPSIVQIKGKANRAPNAEYLPAVQDFVRSGKWSEVGDLGNTGLIDVTQPGPLMKALKDIYGKDMGIGMDKFNAAVEATPEGHRYMTMQEFRKFLGEEPPEGFATGGDVRGYQAGGAVKAAKATAKSIGELVEKYTPEFKQWFSGSKAATPEGEPLTVYRGTTKDEGEIIKNGWFAKDPKVASMFSTKAERIEQVPNSVVTPAHLKMKNPLVIDAKGASWDRIPFGDPRDKMFLSSDKIANFARDEKYDGVIFKNINESDDFFDVDPTDVFVTFDPNQAKSIFNKKPTSDPRIGFAAGGLVSDANFPTGDFDPARIDAIVGELHALNAG